MVNNHGVDLGETLVVKLESGTAVDSKNLIYGLTGAQSK